MIGSRGIRTALACCICISLTLPALADTKGGLHPAKPFSLPNVVGGIGFDDLNFSFALNRVLVPGGRTGRIFLIDPRKQAVDVIAGLTEDSSYVGGHGQSTTSVDFGDGHLFAIDRTSKKLVAIDSSSGKVVFAAALSSDPDYVRYVSLGNELWVTEPDAEIIEIFKFDRSPTPKLTAIDRVSVKGGPESLVIDRRTKRAYAHLWKGKTIAIDLTTRRIVAQWPNGCDASRGIALDEARGFLFAGCAEGRATVLDAKGNGAILGNTNAGAGVDIIAYAPGLQHLYIPGARSATLTVLQVDVEGKLVLLGTASTVPGAHCAVADNAGGVWVCDPDHGRLLFLKDEFPPRAAKPR
jgi:hypothetical protein